MPVVPLSSTNADAAWAFLDQISNRGETHWRWKYGLDTDAPGVRAFYWQEPDGRALGFIGLIRTRLEHGGASVPASWFVDWHVQPGDKAVGIGLGLLRAAEREAGVLLTLQGTADTQRILARLGWRQSTTPVNLLLPLGSGYVGDYLSRKVFSSPAWVGSAVGRLARGWLRRHQPAPLRGAGLVDVARVPPTYDDVWSERAGEFGPAMTRDSAHLNHLCADYPGSGYRIRLVEWDGSIAGHLVTRVDRDGRGYVRGRVVDMVWPTRAPGLARWLLRTGCWEFDRQGVDYVLCTASGAHLQGELLRAGFRPRNPVPIWYHHLPPGAADPDHWHITYLDCDRAYR